VTDPALAIPHLMNDSTFVNNRIIIIIIAIPTSVLASVFSLWHVHHWAKNNNNRLCCYDYNNNYNDNMLIG